MKSGVYLIINIINGKRYIGSSIDVERRFKEHRRQSLHEAAKYYGVNKRAFTYAAKTLSYKIYKCDITFEYITPDEYLRNKTAGEK